MLFLYYIVFGVGIVLGLAIILCSFIFKKTLGKPISNLMLFSGTLMALTFILIAFLFKP
ncbi:MAG: hypothetical protein VB120_04610 [Lachnospiraceae bacterium]|nr:hypothetical protein [Lachnospiraceae bacterium]